MDIVDFIVFKVVIEYGSVSCVVELLYCVFFNVIVWIKKFEKEFNVELFLCINNCLIVILVGL